jgi:hypothetical protein
LRDSVIAGLESTSDQASHEEKLTLDIIKQHTAGHTATRWKYALDVIRTGQFSPKGPQGNAIGLAIDFSRDDSCDITYDFTDTGATIDTALKNLYDAVDDQGVNPSELCVIMGKSWIKELYDDSSVLERMRANSANNIILSNLIPPELKNTEGLYLVGQYLIPGTIAPIYICGYRPQGQWVAYKGATAANFMPNDEAVIFSLQSTRYRVFRGVDALNTNGEAVRAVGEIVFDSYTEKDPVSTYLRSQTRFACVPGEIDHTARSTGTFEEDS